MPCRDESGSGPVTLDVCPLLQAGEEPLPVILEAAAPIRPGGVLEITAPFEPIPLYSVLSERGFGHRAEEGAQGTWVVAFTHLGITRASTLNRVYEDHPSVGPVLSRHGLDMCCGGGKSVEAAAKAHGLDPAALLEELQCAAQPQPGPSASGTPQPKDHQRAAKRL